VLFRQQGKLDLARQSYLKATSLVPDNAEAFSSLVVIELIQGNDAKAVEYGEKAWALRKDYPSIPANLAIAYHYLGNMQKRDEFYQHAQRLGYHDLQAVQDIFSGKTGLR
jgi:Flp pilus assembly protein TadD